MIQHTGSNNYHEIRDAIRALCAEFPDEYFRKVDEARAYPETFVNALTKAGWLAALIPHEYGGSGLGLSICESIVLAHAGSIRAMPSPLGGLWIQVQLPLAPTQPTRS